MRAALYARVSDEEQVEGYILDAQKRAFRAYAESQGWDIYHEYVDEGVSAHTDDVAKRPLFRQMIEDALARRYDVLVVHKLDRFSRNVRITLEYLEKLEKVGVGFVSITEQMDFSTPIGKVMLANLAAFGQYYSDNISAEVNKGLKERALQGLWNGPVPLGYSPEDGKLVAVPEEAQVIKRIFEMYASGTHTDQSIATWLNQTEVRPKHRRRRKDRDYLWTHDSVKGILRNQFYVGYVKYKGELFPGQHPQIITQELFDQVQRARKSHFVGPSTFTPKYRTYLLKGLLRCAQCGEKLWSHNIRGYDYYQETSSQRGIRCPNPPGYVRADVVDEQVSAVITGLRLPGSWRELVVDLLSSKDEPLEIQIDRNRLEEKLRRLKRLYREVEIEEADYRQEVALAQAKLSGMVNPEHAQVVTLGDNVEGVVAAWEIATKEERREMLQMMLDAVYIDMTTKEVVGLKPKAAFLPLFNLDEPVRAGEVVLATSLNAGALDSPQSPRLLGRISEVDIMH